jgi:hypothetical protein
MPNTSTIDQTIIELSRRKIGLIIIGSCAFVAIGIWLFSIDPASIRALPRGSNPTFVHSIGLASVVFFGLCAIAAIPKLFDKKPGLVFASSGIIDNASSVSAGLIPWAEIIGAESFDLRNQKFLIIKVKDPQKYLDRGNRLFHRIILLRGKNKMLQCNISSNDKNVIGERASWAMLDHGACSKADIPK